LADSKSYPKDFRELVSRQLIATYGDRISIRSAIVDPPVQEKTMKGGKEILSFKGSVVFNVLDQDDKDFGRHEMTYVIQNRKVTLEEDRS
jgi:hypothetical protein